MSITVDTARIDGQGGAGDDAPIPRSIDGLSAVKGIAFGVLVSVPFWIAAFAAVRAILRAVG